MRASSATPLSTNVRSPISRSRTISAPVSLFRKLLHREQNFAHRFRRTESAGQTEPPLASNARQRPPDLRLEQDDDSDAEVRHDERKQRSQRLESRPQRGVIEQHHHQNAGQNVAGARTAHHHQALIIRNATTQDVDHCRSR